MIPFKTRGDDDGGDAYIARDVRHFYASLSSVTFDITAAPAPGPRTINGVDPPVGP